MSKVGSVEARTVAVDLERITSFATREVHTRYYCLVRLRDADGIEGVGFCYAGSLGGRVVTTAVRELIAPLVVGQEAQDIPRLWEKVYAELLLHGRAGSVVRAHSAVDVALWDRSARAAGLPLARHLGAVRPTSAPAYASGGYYLAGKTEHDLAEEMVGYVAQGFDAVKIKVGRASPHEDGQRLKTVREAVGDGVRIMLDANNAWSDVPSAVEAMRHLEPYDPYWIEEPFSPDDILSHAELAKRTRVAVATGEIEAGRWRHRELLAAGGAAILQTDAAVCGGITEFRRIAALADAYGVPMCPHWFHDLHIHLVAATPNAQYVEFFPDDSVLNFRKLVDRQLDVLPGGRLAVPTESGLGFGFAAEAVERYAVDEWA